MQRQKEGVLGGGANRRRHRFGAPSPRRPAAGGDGGDGRMDAFLGFSQVIVDGGADARVPPLPAKVREGKEGQPARNLAGQTRQQPWREPSTAPTTRWRPRAGPRPQRAGRPLIGCWTGAGRGGTRPGRAECPLIGCRLAGAGRGEAARYQAALRPGRPGAGPRPALGERGSEGAGGRRA